MLCLLALPPLVCSFKKPYLCSYMRPNIFSHYRATLLLGLPIMVGQIGVIVQSFADTMMVGRYATEALAAAGFVNQIFNLMTFVLLGYSYGLTPLVSGAYGRGNEKEACHYLKQALGSNALFFALLVGIALIIYTFIDRLGQAPEVLPLARPYFLVMLASMFFVMPFNVLRQFTDGTNDTVSAMYCLVISNVLNIVGNYLLIYGIGPFPELGLLGAGISTLVARAVMLFLLLGVVAFRKRYAPYRKAFAKTTLRWKAMWEVHRISFPISMQIGVETACFTISCIMAGWIGKVEAASFQVLMSIGTLGFLIYYSFGAGMSIRIGTFCGTSDWKQAHLAMKAGMHIILVMATLACACFFLLQHHFVALFTEDPNVRAVSLLLMAPLITYQYADAFQIIFANALRGISQVMPMMRASIISYIVVGLPMGYLLGFPLGFGIQGIFFAFSIGLGTAAALFYYYYIRHLRPLLCA